MRRHTHSHGCYQVPTLAEASMNQDAVRRAAVVRQGRFHKVDGYETRVQRRTVVANRQTVVVWVLTTRKRVCCKTTGDTEN